MEQQSPYIFKITNDGMKRKIEAIAAEIESYQRTISKSEIEIDKLWEKHRILMMDAMEKEFVLAIPRPRKVDLILPN